jgi:hypothetical protein
LRVRAQQLRYVRLPAIERPLQWRVARGNRASGDDDLQAYMHQRLAEEPSLIGDQVAQGQRGEERSRGQKSGGRVEEMSEVVQLFLSKVEAEIEALNT